MPDPFSDTVTNNPFACDEAMRAASSQTTVRVVTLTGDGQTCWPLGLCRTPVKLPCLMAPLVPLYDTNATPALTPGKERENLAALFDAVREDRALPKVIVAQNVIADGPVWQALLSLHETRSVEMTTLKAWERSILLRSAAADGETYLAQSLSGSTRKRLRAKRRTLENHGSLVLNFHETQEDISSGFASFLTLEASGWKGKSGTALQQHPQDASYVSAVLKSLSSLQQAFVATLSTGERIIAAGLFLRSGGEVTFWKTAYDETLAKESPGVIFDTMLTEHFYQQPWFTLLDSASDDTVDPAGLIWKQRRKMARVVVDLNPGSWQGKAIVAGYRVRDGLKTLRNRFRSR